MRNQHLISAEALQNRLGEDKLVVLEATFFLPTMERNALDEFAEDHIPTARFFDIDTVADTANSLPHMLPSDTQFAAQMQALGIDADSEIIVYDRSPFLSAARCWWLFRYFGHRKIHVLNGGYKAWLAINGNMQSGTPPKPTPGSFKAGKPFETDCIMLSDLQNLLNNGAPQILDARAKGRFEGTSEEPRPGLPSGHMIGACNLPIVNILDDDGFLQPESVLTSLFEQANIDLDKPIITTCGSGVTAAGLTLALATIGVSDVRLYDGSWSEWASQPDTMIAKGPA